MDTKSMLNSIALIKKIYQIDSLDVGVDSQQIEQAEQQINKQLPALLFHYYRELGNHDSLNSKNHELARLPLQLLGEYLIVAKEPEGEAIWGIHQDDLTQSNPTVMVSRNHDSYAVEEIHWIKDFSLDAFLLSQAIFNGVNGGLQHHAQVYDFFGDSIPADLLDKLANLSCEIVDLKHPFDRYFYANDYQVVFMVTIGENGLPTAFYMGSQDRDMFEQFINQLAVSWDSVAL